jgi:hypothetical protein
MTVLVVCYSPAKSFVLVVRRRSEQGQGIRMGSTPAGLFGLQGVDERIHPSVGQGEQRGVDQRLLPRVGLERYGTRKCSSSTALLLLWDVLIPDHGLSLCSLSASLPSLLVRSNVISFIDLQLIASLLSLTLQRKALGSRSTSPSRISAVRPESIGPTLPSAGPVRDRCKSGRRCQAVKHNCSKSVKDERCDGLYT